MKAAKLPELTQTLDDWRDGRKGLSDVAYILGWPIGRTEQILNRLGIIQLNGLLVEQLSNQDIVNTLLWYYVNICLARVSNRPLK